MAPPKGTVSAVGLLGRPGTEFDVLEQLGQGEAEAQRHLTDRPQVHVVLAALDAANVGPVQACPLGELFLG
jgi:hypothetical protein